MVQRAERLSGSPNNREADLASASSPSPPPRGHLDEWLRSLGRPPQPGEVAAHLASDPAAAADHLKAQQLDADEKTAIWTRFDSKQRSALKKAMAA